LAANEIELAGFNGRIAELRVLISGQDLSAEDVRRMQGERARVEDGLERVMAAKAEHSKTLWEAEIELNSTLEMIETAVNTFNKRTAAMNIDSLKVNREEIHSEDPNALLCGADCVNTVRPALHKIKEVLGAKNAAAKAELLELLDKEEAAEESLAEATKSAESMEKKATRAEEQYASQKEGFDQTIAELEAETEQAEVQAGQLSDPVAMESNLARQNAKLQQLKALRKEKLETATARKEAVHQEIIKALNMAAEHKDYIQTELAALKEMGAKSMEEIEQIKNSE